MGLSGALARDAVGPAVGTLAGAAALAVAAGAVTALWTPGVVLTAPTVLVAAAAAVPVAGQVLAPLATTAGVLAAFSRWNREGAWTGAQACGARGRQLLGACLLYGMAGATITALCTHGLEPWARRAVAERLAGDAAALELRPGEAVRVGSATLLAGGVRDGVWHDLFFTSGPIVGTARRARLVEEVDGMALVLEDGALASTDRAGWHVRFGYWRRSLPPLLPPRVELFQRTDADLAASIAAREAGGEEQSYERTVLYKRFVQPLGALLLPAAVLPAVSRVPWPILMGLLGVGYLVVARGGDHLSSTIGPVPASLAGPLFAAAVAVATWASWRQA